MIDLKKNKTYCPYLFRGAVMQVPDGAIVPCCRYSSEEYDKYPKSFDKGYDDIWNDIRKKALEGKQISGCWRCYHDEKLGLKSMRQGALETANEINYDYKTNPNYNETELEFIEIQTGRYCNLKCRSCGPKLSTTWDEDLDNNSKVIQNFFGNNTQDYIDIKSKPKTNQSLSTIPKETVLNLKNIKATGGEPFLNDQFQVFLSNLVNWDLAKNINIEIFTNCSFFPKEQYRSLLPHFKNVKMNLSLDAIGDRAEFIRKGSIWSKVLDSLHKWIEVSLNNKNVSIALGHTLTVYNVIYLKEFINWIESSFPADLITHNLLDLHLAQTPEYLCLSNLDTQIQKQLDIIITNHKNELLAKHKSKNIIKIVNNSYEKISKGLSVSKKDLSNEFLEKANLFDDVRKENWKKTFPELAEVFDE